MKAKCWCCILTVWRKACSSMSKGCFLSNLIAKSNSAVKMMENKKLEKFHIPRITSIPRTVTVVYRVPRIDSALHLEATTTIEMCL